jgi:PAS domain-containing protein
MIRDHFAALCALFKEFSAEGPAKTEDELWNYLIRSVSAAVECEAATYFEAEETQKTLAFKCSLGPVGEDVIGVSFAYQGIAGWCAENRKPILVQDTDTDTRFTKKMDHMTGFKTKSVLAVPAIAGGRLLGVVEFINPLEGTFGEQDLQLAAVAAGLVARDVYMCRLESTAVQLGLKIESTINSLSGGFIGVDLDGKVISFNPRAREIFEVGEEYLNKNIISLFQLSPDIVSAIGEVLKQGRTVRRQEFKCAVNGTAKVIGYSSICIKGADGAVSGAGIIFQDITSL